MLKTFVVVLSALSLVLSSAMSVRAQEKKADADAEFLANVVPSIAASVKIIEYEVENTSDERSRSLPSAFWHSTKGRSKPPASTPSGSMSWSMPTALGTARR